MPKIDLEKIFPQKATTGLKVHHLTFRPHMMAEIEVVDPMMGGFASMKQAVVQFANGWGMSLVTHTPTSRLMLVHGDERISTYEVAIFDPDGSITEVLYDMEVDEIEILFGTVMAMDYVGGSADNEG